MNDNTINVKGPTLADNGYLVCPIKPGKKACLEQNWQSLRMTAEDCEYWPNHQDGVGILCGVGDYPICGVDMDIAGDEEFSAHMKRYIEKHISYAPIRYGKFPKFLALFRAEEAGWGKTSTNSFQKDGNKVQLEVLGKGNQFVAYHIHPDTEKPYEWENEFVFGSPEFMAAEDLPVITRDQITELMVEFSRKARELGYEESVGTASFVKGAFDDDLEKVLAPPKLPMKNVSIELARRILKDLNLDLTEYDPWVSVGMALHHQFDGMEEALVLWDELSAEFPTYQVGKTDQKWRTFSDKNTNAKTFRSYYAQWRRQRDPLYGELSQTGALERLLHRYRENFISVPEIGRIFVYNEDTGRWSAAGSDALLATYVRRSSREDVEEAIAELGKDDPYVEAMRKFARANRNKWNATEGALLKLVKNTHTLRGDLSQFDADHSLFAMVNGVVDLNTGSLLPYAPTQKIVRYSKVRYDPAATCPTWEKSIYQWVGDDAEMVKFVQRLFGSALTGAPAEDKLVLLRGFGCNGKSVFDNIMRKVFGGYSEMIAETSLFGKGGLGDPGRARADIIKLAGARLAICSETSEMGQIRESDVKRMTGREPFPARAPYEVEEVNVTPSWLLCVTTNYMPVIKGDDDGIWRRILDMEFPRNFDKDPTIKKDTGLEEKLIKELSGVFNWLFEGLREYRRIGLAIPEKVINAVAEYRADSDDVQRWMNERLIEDPQGKVLMQDCLNSFTQFLESENQSYKMTIQSFTRKFRPKIPAHCVYRTNGRTALRGYRLATADDFEENDPFA